MVVTSKLCTHMSECSISVCGLELILWDMGSSLIMVSLQSKISAHDCISDLSFIWWRILISLSLAPLLANPDSVVGLWQMHRAVLRSKPDILYHSVSSFVSLHSFLPLFFLHSHCCCFSSLILPLFFSLSLFLSLSSICLTHSLIWVLFPLHLMHSWLIRLIWLFKCIWFNWHPTH